MPASNKGGARVPVGWDEDLLYDDGAEIRRNETEARYQPLFCHVVKVLAVRDLPVHVDNDDGSFFAGIESGYILLQVFTFREAISSRTAFAQYRTISSRLVLA